MYMYILFICYYILVSYIIITDIILFKYVVFFHCDTERDQLDQKGSAASSTDHTMFFSSH